MNNFHDIYNNRKKKEKVHIYIYICQNKWDWPVDGRDYLVHYNFICFSKILLYKNKFIQIQIYNLIRLR